MAKKTEVNICEECGAEYEDYTIILSNNPLSIASFLERMEKPDGSMRRLCKQCWEKK